MRSESKISTVSKTKTPVLSIALLAVVFAASLFVVGFEQGQILDLAFAQGLIQNTIDPMVIHELTHDMRHAAGFPCH